MSTEDIVLDDIKIDYDGSYPCLCMGHLIITIKDKVWDFGVHVLSTGGSCWFDANWSAQVDNGPWYINDCMWPDGFPNAYKDLVIEKINLEIPWGCCGGCL